MLNEKHPQKPLVIVPTYNEAENVGSLVDEVFQAVPSLHILFVDDNSRDGTRDIIRQKQDQHPGTVHLIERPGKMGLGTAYLTGFAWALEKGYDAVIEMDADFSHNPKDLVRILSELGREAAVAGSRYVRGGGTVNWSLGRKIISRGGSLYAMSILRLPIRDLTGGFNGWSRPVLEKIDLKSIKSEGYAFQIEMKYRATLAGFKVSEIPITFVDRRAGQSKMSSKIVIEAMGRVWKLAFLRGSILKNIKG